MTVTEFDYDNLPNNESLVNALPEELLPEAKNVFRELMDSNLIIAEEVRASYVFKRKGYMDFVPIGEEPNTGYQTATDDLIIQLTMRIPAPNTYTTVPEMQKMEKLVKRAGEARKEAERQRLQEEIGIEEARAAAALNAAKAKREALTKLNQQ